MNYLVCFFLFCVSFIYGEMGRWIEQTIEEEIAFLNLEKKPIENLHDTFHGLSKINRQCLFCQIRNGKVIWEKSVKRDEQRNKAIFEYMARLAKKEQLPDVDFILMTGDGEHYSHSAPVFSFAKMKGIYNVLLFPDSGMLEEVRTFYDGYEYKSREWEKQYPWKSKKNIAFFRGWGTGQFNPLLPDAGNDRVRASLFSALRPDLLDVSFNGGIEKFNECVYPLMLKKKKKISIPDQFAFKFLLDIDGNSCAYARCRWILFSNSTCVKVSSPNVQWFYKALEPWVHYVPVQQDMSDLFEHLEWLQIHDKEAFEIAKNGQKLAREIFSRKAVDEYIVKLLWAYAEYMKR